MEIGYFLLDREYFIVLHCVMATWRASFGKLDANKQLVIITVAGTEVNVDLSYQ
jgi:hypothetical protein